MLIHPKCLPYGKAAAVAITRDMSNPLVYDDEAVRDPLVRRLARDMELEIDDAPHESHGVVPSAEVTIVCGGTKEMDFYEQCLKELTA